MVDLSRLMQDAATLEVIEKSAIEAQVLRHDIEAYRACLGYSVSGDHDGRLSDGTLPNNGIAEALNNECRNLSAQNSAQAMRIDELQAKIDRLRLDAFTWHKCVRDLEERAERTEAALAECRAKLEVDPRTKYDGIDCRDETIRMLEQKCERLIDVALHKFGVDLSAELKEDKP